MKTVVSLLAGLALAAVATGVAHAKGGEVEAALVRCADVTVPGPLTGCGTDPLAGGQIEVKRGGDIEVELAGALPSMTYDVVLQTLNGNASASLALGVVTTDASGNAEMHRRNLFDVNQAGPITFALSRNGSVQFVAGFAGEEELKAALLACGDINVPTALAGCGSDTFRNGSVKIDDGDLMVDFTGMPNVSYDVVLLGLDGTTEMPLGPLTTDKRGRGLLRLMNLFDNVVGAGNIELRSNGSVEFISGFQSTQRRPPENARFQVGLLRCGAVNTLAPLAGCGSDSFTKGLVTLDENGNVKVEIVGALPAVQYEVVFVSFDATAETSIGTFTTNPAGNGHLQMHDFFSVGTRGAGNVVIKRDGVDQFVTGFAVVR
jgi:hypothetical protein